MAEFTFTIRSDDEKEISGLMVRLFGEAAPRPAAKQAVRELPPINKDPTNEDENEEPEVKRRHRRTKAEMAGIVPDEPEADEPEETAPVITLDMVKAAGSKAMGTIKASGVAAIFKSHGGGAESFGTLDPTHYAAVHEALQASL